MTVLIGFKVNQGAILTADKMNSEVDHTGMNTGVQSSVEKISFIRKNMIMSTAGLSQLGSSVIQMLQATLHVRDEMLVQDAMNHVRDTMRFAHQLFQQTNPDVTYLDLVAFVGGYDLENEQSFLYTLSSTDNFEPREVPGYFVSIGPGNESIGGYIRERIGDVSNYGEAAQLFAEAIRTVDFPTVSKDTLTLISYYDPETNEFRYSKIMRDENGELI